MPIPYDRLKQALLTEQAALSKELKELQSTIKEEGVGYSTHPADDGTNAFDQARDLAVQVNAEQTLKLSPYLPVWRHASSGILVFPVRGAGSPSPAARSPCSAIASQPVSFSPARIWT